MQISFKLIRFFPQNKEMIALSLLFGAGLIGSDICWDDV